MQAISWADESLVARRLDRVVLGLEDTVESTLLLNILRNIPNWKVMLEMKKTSKEVYRIAKSASSTHFGQSYVAAGHSGWLQRRFDSEKVGSFA
ncbi:hypothetical protein IGI04_028151 [Brassica rapa subsp. trilocularis]|uniref:Uncharacterized protein n=1 Tax=Brassica rapa subsp. trilocularis TaxID=1813537 RepID=A0ABQ7L443_BRACM|nr:hypothetical protein IGI04_028151 [Brassica rapa subsp. trilocularis]